MKNRKPSTRTMIKNGSPKPRTAPTKTVAPDEITRSAAFRKATAEAEFYAKDPERLGALLAEAREKINHVPRGPFAETWPYLMAMIRLIRAYHQGEYPDISPAHFLVIIAAILYFISPCDVIPDSVPIIGQIDDALVVRRALKSVGADLDTFMAWETARV